MGLNGTRDVERAERSPALLDKWIPPDLRTDIEERFWRPIESLTSLEAMIADEAFFADPGRHIGLYADHGPTHARDVALRVLEIADWAFGSLIEDRSRDRRDFVTGAAVLIALVHDVGMCVIPPVGRRLHAQFATQLVRSEVFADVVDRLVDTDAGRLASTLRASGVEPARGVPEVLACAVAHSKSTVPMATLEDHVAFRRFLQYIARTDLQAQVGAPTTGFADDGTFAWLGRDAELTTDVIDVIRLVRAADALRQRGTTYRTSVGFEVVVDSRTGTSVAVLRSESRRSAFLLEVDFPMMIGEANLRGAELRADALRFDFHRGSFERESALDRVVAATVQVIDDIRRDVLPAFPLASLRVELAEPQDEPGFAHRVAERLGVVDVTAAVPWSATVPAFDWRRAGRPLEAAERAQAVLQLEAHGANVSKRTEGDLFAGVNVVTLGPDETVIRPGEEASFAVVATGPGLVATPLGGYRAEDIQPWIPVGTVGVLRGHDRNSTVRASAEVDVLVVPAGTFLDAWSDPFTADSLRARLAERPLR